MQMKLKCLLNADYEIIGSITESVMSLVPGVYNVQHAHSTVSYLKIQVTELLRAIHTQSPISMLLNKQREDGLCLFL